MKKVRWVVFLLVGAAVTTVLAYVLGVKAANVMGIHKTRQARAEMTTAILQKMGTGLAVGAPLPDGEFEGLDGKLVRLGDITCTKTLIVYVEPECGHCVNQIRAMSKWFTGKAKGCGILISNISTDGLRELQEKDSIDCRLLSDIDGRYKKALNIMSFPSNFIVDKDLRIENVALGELGADEIESLTKQMAKD